MAKTYVRTIFSEPKFHGCQEPIGSLARMVLRCARESFAIPSQRSNEWNLQKLSEILQS